MVRISLKKREDLIKERDFLLIDKKRFTESDRLRSSNITRTLKQDNVSRGRGRQRKTGFDFGSL